MAGLTVVKNPFVPHDGRVVHPVSPERTVKSIIDEYIPDGLAWRAFINGVEVTDENTLLQEGQECNICALVAGGGKENQKTMLRTVAMVVVAIAASYVSAGGGAALEGIGGGSMALGTGSVTFGSTLWGGVIMAGGSLLINSVLPMPTPSADMGLFSMEDSNTYGWNQSRNQLNEGLTVPVLYGTMKIVPQVISRYRTTTGESEQLNMLMVISDGEIHEIKEVKANDTPILNIQDAVVDTRLGTVDQTVIPGFQDTIFEKVINTPVEYGTPVTVTTDGNSVDRLGVGLLFPQGLFTYSGGVYGQMSVGVKLEYSAVGSGIWNDWSSLGTVAHTEAETIIGDSSIEFTGNKILGTSGVSNTLTGDYCFEAHVKMPDTSGESCIFYTLGEQPGNDGSRIILYGLYIKDGHIGLRKYGYNSGYVYDLYSTATIAEDAWTHIAVTVDVSTRVITFYIGGVAVTTLVDFDDGPGYVGEFHIGSQENGTKPFIGFMEGLRISENSVRYAGFFTPPTSDLVNDANTRLILQSTNAESGSSFFDTAGNYALSYNVSNESEISVSNDGSGAYRAYFEHDGLLTPDQYQIRVSIVDPPLGSDSQTLRQSDMYLEYIHEFNADDFAYPGTALLAISAVATEEIYGAQPVITCIATRSTIPQYPVTWGTGTPIDRPADNPAWACYDALVNPLYGMGVALDRIEIQDFIDWANFCTTGGYELNIYMDQGLSLYDALSQMSQVGRGCIVQRGTTFGAIWDDLGTRVHLYTPGNIIMDSYRMQYLDMEARANIIDVTYFDDQLDYDRKVATVLRDNTTDQAVERKSSIVLYGCTSREQAVRHGKYLLNTNEYLRRVITFDADVDSIVCEVGDIIGFAHDVPRYGEGGRVVSATSTSAVLSREVTFETGKNYSIIVKDPADNVLETQTVNNPGDVVTDSITLTGSWTSVPAKHWVYSFGETDTEVKDFRVTSISRSGELRGSITAVEYREEVYSDSITIPDYEQESNLPDLTTLVLNDVYEAQPDGSYVGKIYATWRGYTTHWMYTVTDDSGRTIASGSTDRRELTIEGVTEGKTYSVLVRAPYNGTELFASVTMALTAPDAPEYVSATTFGEIVTLNWAVPASDIPVARYEILKGATEETATLIGKSDTTSFTFTEPVSGTFTYWVRAVDSAGRVGDATTVVVGVQASSDFKTIATMEYTGSATTTAVEVDAEGDILIPADTTTWGDWWDAVGATTWQDFIDDGYETYLAPNTGVYPVTSIEETFDLGGEVTSGVIDVTYDVTTIYGNVAGLTVQPTISYSDDDITYTDSTGSFQVPATGFRYVKIKLVFVRADSEAIYVVNPTLKVVAKGFSEAGTGTITVANDGKLVNLVGSFAQVTGITVTPLGDVDKTAQVTDITGTAFPSTFTVYLRSSGVKTTGDFSYNVIGY